MSSEIVAKINALFRAVIVGRVGHMRMLARTVSCHIGTKHVAVTLEIETQCMRA
jgi:hypothetical protein